MNAPVNPSPPASRFIFDATYTPTGTQRYSGNPFIEALDPYPTLAQMVADYSNSPPVPTDQVRSLPAAVRRLELNQLHDIVVLFPEYLQLADAFHSMIREAYHYRNPFTVAGRKQRYAAAHQASGESLESELKSTARGHLLMALSGMGKSTFSECIQLTFPPVIRHKEYNGQPFNVHQIPVIALRVPHDGTLRSMCIQFFDSVDLRLNTRYGKRARGRTSIAQMVDLMKKVATAVSLGLLVIDEVQNLRVARIGQAEQVLNLFTEIIEKVGVSIFIIATPALQEVIVDSYRNTRKFMTEGSTLIHDMQPNDEQWLLFTDTLWRYQYVAEKRPLTPAIRKVWHELSGGTSAIASLLYYLAQRDEISDRDYLDADSFRAAYATYLSFLHPAIKALLSKDPAKLDLFDDLMVSERWQSIRKMMGAKDNPLHVAPNHEPEFEEVTKALKATATTPPVTNPGVRPKDLGVTPTDFTTDPLPIEDPFSIEF